MTESSLAGADDIENSSIDENTRTKKNKTRKASDRGQSSSKCMSAERKILFMAELCCLISAHPQSEKIMDSFGLKYLYAVVEIHAPQAALDTLVCSLEHFEKLKKVDEKMDKDLFEKLVESGGNKRSGFYISLIVRQFLCS